MDKKKTSLFGYAFLVSNAFAGLMLTLPRSYYSYAFTDIAGIDPAVMAGCLTVVNLVALFFSIFNGAFIQNTRTKMGQYRPWLLIAAVACIAGVFMMFCSLGYGALATAVLIAAGYMLSQVSNDFITTARNGILGKVSGKDSEVRNVLGGRSYQGNYLASLIGGMTVLPLINFFRGKGFTEAGSFRLTHLILSALVMIGTFILLAVSKPYDTPGAAEETKKEAKTSFPEMLKGVLLNPPALVLIICDVVRFTGYFLFSGIMVYHCTYVLGDMNVMTTVLPAYAVAAFLGATAAPYLCEKLGGRKNLVIASALMCGICCLGICLFGQSRWGFIIPVCMYFFFSGQSISVDVLMYMDAGEYWLHETGKDTRSFNISVFNLAAKISITLAGILTGVVLKVIGFVPGAELTAGAKTLLTWITGGSIGIGYLSPAFILMFFYRISDNDAQRYISENAEKYNK